MANTVVSQILADGPRNAVVNIIGQFDTTDPELAAAAVVDITNFVNNDSDGTLNGFRVDKIQHCNSENLALRLFWEATAPQPIAGLAGGHGEFCFGEGNGLQPTVGAAGYTGNIDLTINNIEVAAADPIMTFTILLYLTKIYS